MFLDLTFWYFPINDTHHCQDDQVFLKLIFSRQQLVRRRKNSEKKKKIVRRRKKSVLKSKKYEGKREKL
jgi:hypothetical protein